MKTPNIDLEQLLNKVITTLNEQHKETFKVFEVVIKQSNEVIDLPLPKVLEGKVEQVSKKCICKTIFLYCSDTRTNFRSTLWERKLVLETAVDVLRYNYKRRLYEGLFTQLLQFSLINLAYQEKEVEVENIFTGTETKIDI